MYVTTRWQMFDDWSDMNAHFTFGGQPGLTLATLFKRDPLGWALEGSTLHWHQAAGASVLGERRHGAIPRGAGSGNRGQDDVRQKVNELRTERKKEVIEKAKIAAMAAFQQAKENRKATAKARPKAAAA